MIDKKGQIIKIGQICKSHDRYGGTWTGRVDKGYGFENTDTIFFITNYGTVISDYWSQKLEIIGTVEKNIFKYFFYCDNLVYGFKKVIWLIRHYFNNKYKIKKFIDLNGKEYY